VHDSCDVQAYLEGAGQDTDLPGIQKRTDHLFATDCLRVSRRPFVCGRVARSPYFAINGRSIVSRINPSVSGRFTLT
jgi:hypothetical protein